MPARALAGREGEGNAGRAEIVKLKAQAVFGFHHVEIDEVAGDCIGAKGPKNTCCLTRLHECRVVIFRDHHLTHFVIGEMAMPGRACILG